MFDHKHAYIYILSSKYLANGKMNGESFWVMASTTPTWVSLGTSGKVIRASRNISSHLHVNTFFVKASGQVPTFARSMIISSHNQGMGGGVKEDKMAKPQPPPRVRLKTIKKHS